MPKITSDVFSFPGGQRRLSRPHAQDRGLRAWDAADELLLDYAWQALSDDEQSGQRVLVVDDRYGALTLGLEGAKPVTVADSATLGNSLDFNAPGSELAGTFSWLEPPTGPFDLVVMRIPRERHYLEWLLWWVNGVLAPGARVLAGGMIKHLPDCSARVFAGALETLEVSPARKKARVVVCGAGQQVAEPRDAWLGYTLPEPSLSLQALPAVFARQSLDIGTRLLLPELLKAVADLPSGARVLDLGCGNGILGLSALSVRNDLEVTFCDVSSQAVASARRNLQENLPGLSAEFCHSDGIPDEAGRFDLVLLNPPFHEGGVVGDHIALRLFDQTAKHLAPGGKLLMVGNRHLGYHRSLKRFFTGVRQRVADPRFVVFRAGV